MRMRTLISAMFAAGALAAAPGAFAQDIQLDLDPSAQPETVVEPDNGVSASDGASDAVTNPDAETAEAGFYYYDQPLSPGDEPMTGDGGLTGGPTPELHVVRDGDTLWDICDMYYSDPWQWPRVWSYNPAITNPHWIYPGDLVRLREEGELAMQSQPAPDGGAGELAAAPVAQRRPARGFSLRQLAFVEREQLDSAFTIAGSEEERTMLSFNDVVYLEYPEGNPPQVGNRYAIYSPTETIKHPKTGKQLGSFVRVLGDLEVLSVKQDKRARAIIRGVDDVIERGHRVGQLERTYRDLKTTPNEKNLQGTIVAQLGGDLLIGAREVVFTDIGARHGIEPGNRLYVIRRGDAYPGDFGEEVGKNDQRFPAYAIGEILIVDVGESTSVGLVTLSLQESESGDMVLMRVQD